MFLVFEHPKFHAKFDKHLKFPNCALYPRRIFVVFDSCKIKITNDATIDKSKLAIERVQTYFAFALPHPRSMDEMELVSRRLTDYMDFGRSHVIRCVLALPFAAILY